MTTVLLNNEGIDIVEIKLETTGSNFCHFTSQDNLLNSDLEYIFGVTDLNVDCSLLPIFAPGTTDTLITIKKRLLLGTLANIEDAEVSPEFRIRPTGAQYHDVTTFIAALSTYANTFSQQLDADGIVAAEHGGGADIPAGAQANETPYLKIGIDPSGRLEIQGIAQFWNHFVITFSDFALKLFHFEHVAVNNTLSVSFDNVNHVYTTDGLVNQQGVIIPGGNLTKSQITAENSILVYADQRLYLTCETHLSIKQNLKVLDGKEKTDRSIVRVPFLNEAVSTIFSRQGGIVKDISLTTKSYSGRMSFVNKTQPIRQWNQLISSYEQKMFRFQIYCIYNVFQNGKFSQVQKDVPFTKNGSWDISIRFVNKI